MQNPDKLPFLTTRQPHRLVRCLLNLQIICSRLVQIDEQAAYPLSKKWVAR